MTGIDPAKVNRDDTIVWRLKSGRGHAIARVQWADAEHVHVMTGDGRRYKIPWERVTEHHPGRSEYDRRIGGKGVTRRRAG